ncbi:(2Fe-2S)-binding protein [Thiomicrorhabdus sp. ZW0627]|uniref:(2Fe-2S)-binding protein n=1 Tax=Thiomicrorhabdus sp. ZW0627 TaxID=3039774 RepID=UPI0024363A15|nr:(2Fe-2S)-binding protein [Thiomicrorhabdus sp. ZW0627]MDG6774713.1 (2Fe-2S)-binding protein [Thiomicrorhabdus sp. ZW0627]
MSDALNSPENDTEEMQQQVCVCYDVMRWEIVESIRQGADTVEKVSDTTYACQGCGGCRPKIESLIEQSSRD